MPLALLALTLSAFAIGTTEFVIVGLVPTIASDLSVSLPSAGLLVSLYAIGVAVGAPVLTALTGRWNRKSVLLSLMALFVFGNLLAWQAPSYESLILARIMTGLAHGVFFSIGSTIATSLVSKDKEASAIAIMFTGLTVALVTGVPLGTWIGWRATFLVVSALGFIALLGSALLIPKNLKQSASASLSEQAKVLLQPRLLLVYLMTILGYGGTFTAFTYLAPILQQEAGFNAATVSIIMLVYGVSVAVGNIYGGKLADKKGPISALTIIFALLSVILAVLTFTMQSKIGVVITVLVWGAFAFGNVPGLQVYVVQLAGKFSPKAVDVASGLNITAFNVGIALGSVLGGQIVENMSLQDTAWVGALISAAALLATRFSGHLDNRAQVVE